MSTIYLPYMAPTIGAYNPTTYDGSSFNPWNQSGNGYSQGQYAYGTQKPQLGNTDPSAGIQQWTESNGYAGFGTVSNVANPYANQIQWGENQATGMANQYQQAAPQMQGQIQQGMQGMQDYNQSTMPPGSYPTYPNSAGIGSQMGAAFNGQAPQMPGAGNMGAGASTDASNTTHGFNPWSLTGEAMTRKN